jgi:hypothetical protein
MAEDKNANKNNNQVPFTSRLQSLSGVVMLVVTLGNVLIGLLNIGIASKLEPLASDLRLVTNRVSALEVTSINHLTDGEFSIFTRDLYSRLDRMENKLDAFIAK